MKLIANQSFSGERALFKSDSISLYRCHFYDGESPLKESSNLELNEVTFSWKYPLWYCSNVTANRLNYEKTARSGVWYTKHIKIIDTIIDAPKTFRRSSDISLINVKLTDALETLWNCFNVKLDNVEVHGDYFGMNSSKIKINNMVLKGNYGFDGASDIKINNSELYTKDAFWNVKNVVVSNSLIVGEYLAWNSKNVTFINCKIISHQGLCYMDNVKLVNCELIDSDLCFEYCSNIDADIKNVVESIKNPISGKISVKGVKKLILENDKIDPSKTKIEIYE